MTGGSTSIRQRERVLITRSLPSRVSKTSRAAYLRQLRPHAARLEVGSERARFDELREALPQIDLDTFITLLSKPVTRRSRYAEAFGKRVVRLLKDFLEVPAHRPRSNPSPAELEDDKWLRGLAAYIWNFPEEFS